MTLIVDLARSVSWEGNPPASEEQILRLEEGMPLPLPPGFLTFLRSYNGGVGSFSDDHFPVRIMSAEEILKYQSVWSVPEVLPGYVLFGSDCGDFALLFDTNPGITDGEYPVVMCPIAYLGPDDVEPLAHGFADMFYLPRE